MSAQGLPAHILALFTPRPPPQHLPAMVKKRKIEHEGLADYVDFFSDDPNPEREAWESPLDRRARRHQEKLQAHKEELKLLVEKYDPHKDPNTNGDPFKTLFVARISYDTTEKKLKREFEVFGSIKKVRMVYDQKGKPRGYAFIEYEHERDLKNAYKQGDGKKIDSRRVMVDVERGRTVEGWLPRRLGGGRGPGRVSKPSKKKLRIMEAEKRKEKEKEKEKEKDRKEGGDRDRDRDRGDRGDRDRRDAGRGGDRDRDRDRRGGDDRDRKRRRDD